MSMINKENVQVALCVISKWEDQYLKEYVEHYKSLGFNNILFYDNNELNDNKQYDVLKQYIDEGFVIYHDWRGKKENLVQRDSYNDCAKKYKEKYDWIAFFDVDEFLELVEHKSIQDFLNSNEKFKEFDGIMFNWLMYKDNGLVYNDGRTLKERFDIKGNTKKVQTCKSIIKCSAISEKCKGVHFPLVKRKKCCNTNGEENYNEKNCNKSSTLYFNKAYLKHYKNKTIEETINRIKRGDCNPRGKLDNKNLRERLLYESIYFFKINEMTDEKIDLLLKNFPEYKNDILEMIKNKRQK